MCSIDGSRVFYLRVLPFIRKKIKNYANYPGHRSLFSLKEFYEGGNDSITEEQSEIIGYAVKLSATVMATAVRRLAIQVLPESVVMRFDADRSTMKASTPVSAEMIASVEKSYLTEADQAITRLQQFLTNRRPENNSDVLYSPVDYSREKFFSMNVIEIPETGKRIEFRQPGKNVHLHRSNIFSGKQTDY